MSSRKRLFQITDTHTGKAVDGLYFGDKSLAKRKRQELNGPTTEDSIAGPIRYVVSPGPDHHNYKG